MKAQTSPVIMTVIFLIIAVGAILSMYFMMEYMYKNMATMEIEEHESILSWKANVFVLKDEIEIINEKIKNEEITLEEKQDEIDKILDKDVSSVIIKIETGDAENAGTEDKIEFCIGSDSGNKYCEELDDPSVSIPFGRRDLNEITLTPSPALKLKDIKMINLERKEVKEDAWLLRNIKVILKTTTEEIIIYNSFDKYDINKWLKSD